MNFKKAHLTLTYIRRSFWKLDYRYRFPEKKFIIYGSGRSGSTLLTSMLNTHSDIYCDAEILAKKYAPNIIFPNLYISSISKKASHRRKKNYGCGLMSTHLREQKFLDKKSFLENLSRDWRIFISEEIISSKWCFRY
jgi:hypothetical protein